MEKKTFTPCLCGYYVTRLINFLHFLLSVASYMSVESDNLFV